MYSKIKVHNNGLSSRKIILVEVLERRFRKAGNIPRYNNNSYFRGYSQSSKPLSVPCLYVYILKSSSFQDKTLIRKSRDEIMRNLGARRTNAICISVKIYRECGSRGAGKAERERMNRGRQRGEEIAATDIPWSLVDLHPLRSTRYSELSQ